MQLVKAGGVNTGVGFLALSKGADGVRELTDLIVMTPQAPCP